ncbi:MAG: ABC transporter permease subunit [Gammaproteobacteria bacterium]|nr:ABC transporter permease subunit [Gammaproteobacteria bacterium]
MSSLAADRDRLVTAAQAVRGRSLWRAAAARFLANRSAVFGLVLLVLIIGFALLAPLLSPHDMEETYWERIQIGPTFENSHWFGTDANGRDLFVRVAAGGRISLAIGLITALTSLLIGVIYGAIAGYVGGRTDEWMMRIVDVLYALPLIFFIIILVTVFGRNILLVFLAIGCIEWLTIARIVRGQTIAVKETEYIEAARALGVPFGRMVLRHVVPNVLGPVIVFSTLLIPTVILVESFLSFLGLGVQEPSTSWGLLISQGTATLDTAPWLLLIPAGFLAATMFAFNFIGDGLRDALDPRAR